MMSSIVLNDHPCNFHSTSVLHLLIPSPHLKPSARGYSPVNIKAGHLQSSSWTSNALKKVDFKNINEDTSTRAFTRASTAIEHAENNCHFRFCTAKKCNTAEQERIIWSPAVGVSRALYPVYQDAGLKELRVINHKGSKAKDSVCWKATYIAEIYINARIATYGRSEVCERLEKNFSSLNAGHSDQKEGTHYDTCAFEYILCSWVLSAPILKLISYTKPYDWCRVLERIHNIDLTSILPQLRLNWHLAPRLYQYKSVHHWLASSPLNKI